MKFFYTIFFFLLVSISSKAQNIKVLSEFTKEPIFGVAIYNVDKSESVITNFRGRSRLNQIFGYRNNLL